MNLKGEDGLGGAGLSGAGFEFGVDPNEDPELALVSMLSISTKLYLYMSLIILESIFEMWCTNKGVDTHSSLWVIFKIEK